MRHSSCHTLLIWILCPFLGCIMASEARAAELELFGFVAGRGQAVEGQPSWLTGGFGRFSVGAEGVEDEASHAVAKAQLALDWRPTRFFGAYLHLVGRAEPTSSEGRAAGIFEAYIHGTIDLPRGSTWRLRLGHFLLPTSRENVEGAWSSPYTLTLSSLNSWIGEEMRLTGLASELRLVSGRTDEVRLGATLFGGNDTLGSLLAWRGWSLGDRLTTFGETLPLPPLDSLDDGGAFAVQQDRGTQPFGDDLDGRLGWAAHLAWQRPERFVVQLSHLDNRGDRRLHRGEYAWQTDIDLLGAELHFSQLSLAGEALWGSTGMGLVTRSNVQMDFSAAYGLVSWHPGSLRFTVRFDTFQATERDFSPAEINDDDGHAWTLAWFWEPGAAFRLGLEFVDLEAERPAAAESGFNADTRGRSLLLEARYYFGL